MTKRNRAMSIGLIVLVLAIVTSCVAGSAFAKYTTNVDGEDSARVAKWQWAFNKDGEGNLVFDLFNTIKDTDDADETDVKVGDEETIIAPGTKGSFTISITNESEVVGYYGIVLAATNNGVPIRYTATVGGNDYEGLEAINGALALSNEKSLAFNEDAAITINWEWIFSDGADEADTALGTAGTAIVTVSATITFTQKD